MLINLTKLLPLPPFPLYLLVPFARMPFTLKINTLPTCGCSRPCGAPFAMEKGNSSLHLLCLSDLSQPLFLNTRTHLTPPTMDSTAVVERGVAVMAVCPVQPMGAVVHNRKKYLRCVTLACLGRSCRPRCLTDASVPWPSPTYPCAQVLRTEGGAFAVHRRV